MRQEVIAEISVPTGHLFTGCYGPGNLRLRIRPGASRPGLPPGMLIEVDCVAVIPEEDADARE